MFMTTTLAHYQLPLLQRASAALHTEIGADQRSVFVRPITSAGPAVELPPAQIVAKPERTSLPFEFKQWLARLQSYEASAGRETPRAAEGSESSPTTPPAEPQPAASAASAPVEEDAAPAAQPQDTGPQPVGASAGTGSEPAAAPAADPSSSQTSDTSRNTGLLGLLFR